MFQHIKRYFISAKIFRFFSRHSFIYSSIAKELFLKVGNLSSYHRPRNIVLKLHSKCNAKCKFCYAQNDTLHTGNLEFKDWLRIIDQAKEIGCYTVTLSGGEPLIYPRLTELIEYIQKKRMLSFTTTNGIKAEPDLIKELEKSGLCALNWSLHGPKNHHNELVGNDQAFDNIMEYGEFCARNTKIICLVNHVCTRESMRNKWYDYVWELMKPKGFRALNLLPVCIDSNDKSGLLTEDLLKDYDQLAKRDYVLMDTKNYALPICPAAKEDIFINNYGEVQPCPFIPITFGNVQKEPLFDILLKTQNHDMFNTDSSICMPARDNEFIDKYLIPAFKSDRLPMPIEEIKDNGSNNSKL